MVCSLSQHVEGSVQRLLSFHDTARLDAEVLTAYALNFSRTQLYTWSDKILTDAECELINALVDRRRKGEPVAYIVGHQEFWSLNFKVTVDTLIPRPETESLVELALNNIPVDKVCRIMDLGTGTGAIAIAIAKERPQCQVVAIDESVAALKVAIENATALGVTNVSFKQSDWFNSVDDKEVFDMLVSNPPYIEEKDKHLSEGDVACEPKNALVSGADGLDDIRKIIGQAQKYLKESAALIIEHGWDQAPKVRSIFCENVYDDICSHKDLSGIERITMGRYSISL